MRAGALRFRVTLEEPSQVTTDSDGGRTKTWQPLTPSQVWCSIAPATARQLERVAAGTVTSTATHVVSMRFHAGVTTKTRVTFGDRQFQVVGVMSPDELQIETIALCKEIVA